MIHFDMPPQKSNIIKVLGFGGGGGNAVNHMFRQQIQNVDFIVCNTDAQALSQSPVPNKVQLGPHLTSGLGAGANPEIGKKATEESLEEIRRMLEVNTKMAFITAGMGGGTGTGGAPTVARICRELGILTVGIVTTPFSFEGPKRMAQAQAGVHELKQHVDTLLVISNDKLRHQYGNLKMKDAFSKADDVLTTAARCITDVINSTGQINVDFADVCTVMSNGGVAILGSAQVAGEDRALKAIEAATNSPLLNDNDIAGAKWILLNITSSEGEHEYTMDEVEIIQNYVRQQTGEQTDVILGMGYDESLGDKLGITLIATGFRHKDPFAREEPPKPEVKPIVMVLGREGEEKKMEEAVEPKAEAPAPMMPVLETPEPLTTTMAVLTQEADSEVHVSLDPMLQDAQTEASEAPSPTIHFELQLDTPAEATPIAESLLPETEVPPLSQELHNFLHRPAQVYVEEPPAEQAPPAPAAPPAEVPVPMTEQDEEAAALAGMTLTIQEMPDTGVPVAQADAAGDSGDLSEEELQKRRAIERMNRLRNLSFNPLNVDNNSEFEEVPAYMRRNLDLHNAIANVEDFYSRATVKSDENNQAQINTANNFLHGEKPD